MSSKFLDWYTQALGATFGMMACIYAYLNGFMFVYGNINKNFDFLGFDGVLSSYFLYPLCILTLILAFVKSYIQKKDILNISFTNFNMFVIICTILIGFMGAKIYFTIPALFIIFSIVKPYIFGDNTNSVKVNEEDSNIENKAPIIQEANIIEKDDKTIEDGIKIKESIDLLLTKREMARELLEKNSNIQFITEITGLSIEEINTISEELDTNHNEK